jgi:hypothetical protein
VTPIKGLVEEVTQNRPRPPVFAFLVMPEADGVAAGKNIEPGSTASLVHIFFEHALHCTMTSTVAIVSHAMPRPVSGADSGRQTWSS